jgi:hypothetical protein
MPFLSFLRLDHPALWVAALLAGRAAWSHARWLGLHRRTFPAGTWARRGVDWIALPEAQALAALLYHVLPYLVAIGARLGDRDDLGLRPPTPASLLAALAAAIAVAALVALNQWWFQRSTGWRLPRGPLPLTPEVVGAIALEALMREAHWAFFRSAPLAIGMANRSAAVFLALAVLALESWTDPRRREMLLEPRAALELARGAALAVLSAVVFLASGSVVVCLGAHGAAVAALAAFGALPAPEIWPVVPAVPDASTIEPTVV